MQSEGQGVQRELQTCCADLENAVQTEKRCVASLNNEKDKLTESIAEKERYIFTLQSHNEQLQV